MRNTTINHIRHMTHEFYFKRPMQMIQLRFKKTIDEIPHLMNALDRSVNHYLNREYPYKIKLEQN